MLLVLTLLTLLTRRELLPGLLELLLAAVLRLLVVRPVLRELAGLPVLRGLGLPVLRLAVLVVVRPQVVVRTGLDRRGTVSLGGGLRRVRVLGRLRGRSGHGDFLLLDLGHNRTPHPTHA